MYATGDHVPSTQRFDAGDWGSITAEFIDYIVHDLQDKHWNSIFIALHSYGAQAAKEEAAHNGALEEEERVPLALSDPPSPDYNN